MWNCWISSSSRERRRTARLSRIALPNSNNNFQTAILFEPGAARFFYLIALGECTFANILLSLRLPCAQERLRRQSKLPNLIYNTSKAMVYNGIMSYLIKQKLNHEKRRIYYRRKIHP